MMMMTHPLQHRRTKNLITFVARVVVLSLKTLLPSFRGMRSAVAPIMLVESALANPLHETRVPLKSRVVWFYRLLKIIGAPHLDLSSKHLVMTRDIQHIKIRPSETKV